MRILLVSLSLCFIVCKAPWACLYGGDVTHDYKIQVKGKGVRQLHAGNCDFPTHEMSIMKLYFHSHSV